MKPGLDKQAVTQVCAIANQLIGAKQTLVFAESCTGGLLSKLATDLAGSSSWFERGLVTYTNSAKHQLLGVPESVFETEGAVSKPCVEAMAVGLMRHTPGDWGVAVTGIAGPGGGTADKPVGTVWIAWIRRGATPEAQRFVFTGDREAVRSQTAVRALSGLLERLQASEKAVK